MSIPGWRAQDSRISYNAIQDPNSGCYSEPRGLLDNLRCLMAFLLSSVGLHKPTQVQGEGT